MLTMPQQLMLLALDDERGKVVQSSAMALPFALAGAALMELQRLGRIDLTGPTVAVCDTKPTGDPVLDDVLHALDNSSKPRKLSYWMSSHHKLAPKMRERVTDQLVDQGILQREPHEALWVFRWNTYPTIEERPERAIRTALGNILFGGATPTEEEAMLLALVHACNLAKEVFPDAPARETRRRLKEFATGDQIAKAVSDSVAAVTTAIIAASTAVMISTSVNH